MAQSSYTGRLFLETVRCGDGEQWDTKATRKETVVCHAGTVDRLGWALFNELVGLTDEALPEQLNKITYAHTGLKSKTTISVGIQSNRIRVKVLCDIDARYMVWKAHGLARAKRLEFINH